MNLNAKTVLVTGAGGFVGSHLVERLVRENCKVRCLIEYDSRGDIGWLEDVDADVSGEIEIIAGDLRDADAVGNCVAGMDAVFHLGALIAIPYSYENPRQVVETNVIGTLNVVQAARAANVERVVHTSTSEVYGTARSVPIGEDHALQGQSPYSASKIGADKIAALCGKDVTVVRDEARIRPGKSEVERLWADNTLARETFGWGPGVGFEEGLKQTIE
ncbi:MAG: SDR family NAD(P)-dependent oxidoreductase, partial [Rhodospirillales bacterium]|nr:SDR family NAD(P)-dependent oxidoreductase [Rhodospirillales bacterium]